MSHAPGRLILLGGGGHAAVVADAARASGWEILGYLDDQHHANVNLKHLGSMADCTLALGAFECDVAVHAAIGDASLRKHWYELAQNHPVATIIHPAAVVSPSASIGAGVYVGPLAVINARAVIERGAIINTAAIIEHDCVVGAFSHIAPKAVLAGGAQVADVALIGCGAIVLPGVCIGEGSTLGAGAVATRDVPVGAVAVGTPARASHVTS